VLARALVTRFRPLLLALALAGLAWLGAEAPAWAATIQVTTSQDELDSGQEIGFGCSLREAVESANTNTDTGGCVATGAAYGDDQITFAAGTNDQPIVLSGSGLVITSNIQITGNGAAQTIIDGNIADPSHAVRPFTVNDGFTVGLTALTIRNGSVNTVNSGGTPNGGGVSNAGMLTISNSAIEITPGDRRL